MKQQSKIEFVIGFRNGEVMRSTDVEIIYREIENILNEKWRKRLKKNSIYELADGELIQKL